jgi:hypothetical protein
VAEEVTGRAREGEGGWVAETSTHTHHTRQVAQTMDGTTGIRVDGVDADGMMLTGPVPARVEGGVGDI